MAFAYEPEFGGKGLSVKQPARVVVTIADRTLVFPVAVVDGLAEQMEASGYRGIAESLRATAKTVGG
jgi:hypothetical protein